MSSVFEVRRRDLLIDADAIRELAESLQAGAQAPPSVPDSLLVVTREMDTLLGIIGKRGVGIISHPVMRARVEYLLYCLHALVGSILIENRVILTLFRLFQTTFSLKRYNPHSRKKGRDWSEDEDILFWEEEEGCERRAAVHEDVFQRHRGKSSWLDLSLASYVALICKILQKIPSLVLALPLTNDEAVALISSSFWQVQLLGLAHACASIDLEARTLVKGREEGKVEKKEIAGGRDRRTLTDLKGIKRENSSRKGKLAFSSSTGTLPMLAKGVETATGTPYSITLSRSGGLRVILWCLLHRQPSVRAQAEIFLRDLLRVVSLANEPVKEKTKAAPARRPSLKDTKEVTLEASTQQVEWEVWIACVEQGLVVLLETVAQGIPIIAAQSTPVRKGDSARFPELSIRLSASSLLERMAADISGAQAGNSRQRLLSALAYSAIDHLRRNTLLSLLFLSGRSSLLAQHLFGASPRETLSSLSLSLKRSSSFLMSPSSGQISLQSIFGQDQASIQSLLKILLHFAEAGEDWLAGMQSQQHRDSKNRSCEVGTQTTTSEKRKAEGFVDQWPNVVQIRPNQERGSAIRMNCPPVSAVAVFCPALAQRMEAAQRKQQDFLQRPMKSIETIHSALQNLPDDLFEVLEGDYATWQEVFSHMADGYLRQMAFSKLSLQRLLNCLALAHQHQMEGELVASYCLALSRRLEKANLTSMVQRVCVEVSDDNKVTTRKLHLSLFLAIFLFLQRHPSLLQDSSKESSILWQSLHSFLNCMVMR